MKTIQPQIWAENNLIQGLCLQIPRTRGDEGIFSLASLCDWSINKALGFTSKSLKTCSLVQSTSHHLCMKQINWWNLWPIPDPCCLLLLGQSLIYLLPTHSPCQDDIFFCCCYCLKSWKYFGPKYYLEIWLTWLSLQWVGNSAQRVNEELTPLLIKDFFFVWWGPFLKSLLNFSQCCSYFMFWIFGLWGRWDLSTLTRDRTLTPCVGRQSPNHWTTREVLLLALISSQTSWLALTLLPSELMSLDHLYWG